MGRGLNQQVEHNEFEIYCNGCVLEDELSLNFISHVIWGMDSNIAKNDSNNDKNGPNTSRSTDGATNENTATLTLEYKYIMRPDQVGTKD